MDFSKLTDTQRKELEQLQKQFQEHQAQQQKQQQESAAAAAAAAAAAVQQLPPAYDPSQAQQPPAAYDPSQVQQSYGPSQGYDQSYYYNYHYQDPSQQQQPPPSQQQQYDPAYYQTAYSNAYQQPQQYTHPETSSAPAYTAPVEQKGNEGSGSGPGLGSGQPGVGQIPVQDPYFDPNNQVNSAGTQPNPGYPVPTGLNAAAAAAVAALSQLTQFAGSMGAAERAMGGGGYFPPVAGAGHFGQAPFRPPVGHGPFRGGGRRGGAPFRGGGGRGSSGPPFAGRGRGRGRGRPDPPSDPVGPTGPPSSQPTEGAPPVRIAWCELCQVDCNSQEILEQHKNGKRHKKNLLMKGPISETQKDGKPVSETQKEEKPVTENEATDDQEKKPWLKRKTAGRGGTRGGKRPRPAGPTRPKVVIPLMCDLCNVKCDTQEVFDRHVAGKKHVAKLKRFEGHRAVYGPTAVQALYPPNPLAQTLGPQPGYYGAPSSHPPADTYAPVQPQNPNPNPNPNPQLADAPLQFGTQNAAPVTRETPAGNGA